MKSLHNLKKVENPQIEFRTGRYSSMYDVVVDIHSCFDVTQCRSDTSSRSQYPWKTYTYVFDYLNIKRLLFCIKHSHSTDNGNIFPIFSVESHKCANIA